MRAGTTSDAASEAPDPLATPCSAYTLSRVVASPCCLELVDKAALLSLLLAKCTTKKTSQFNQALVIKQVRYVIITGQGEASTGILKILEEGDGRSALGHAVQQRMCHGLLQNKAASTRVKFNR